MVLVGSGSVEFDADPDSGSSLFFIRIRIQVNDTDSTDPDPQHCFSVLWIQNDVFRTLLKIIRIPDPTHNI